MSTEDVGLSSSLMAALADATTYSSEPRITPPRFPYLLSTLDRCQQPGDVNPSVQVLTLRPPVYR